jgi:Ferritin-like domain
MDLFIYYSLWLTAFALLLVSTMATNPPGTDKNMNKLNCPPPPFLTCPINASEIPRIQYLIPYGQDSPRCVPMPPHTSVPVFPYDKPPFHFALNLEFIEAEWFLHGALGYGLDQIAPNLAHGGPPPIDGHKANLDEVTQKIITEFAFQEVGHVRFVIAPLYLSC